MKLCFMLNIFSYLTQFLKQRERESYIMPLSSQITERLARQMTIS